MNRRFVMFVLSAALGLVMVLAREARPNQASSQDAATPTADPYANNANAGTTKFPLAAPAGKDSGAITKPLPGGVNQGAIDEKTWKYGHTFRRAGRQQDLESGEAQDDAGREGDRRNGIRFVGSLHLLRDGQRRLRLHLDRDAARFPRLGKRGQDVAGLPARQGRSRRARGLRE